MINFFLDTGFLILLLFLPGCVSSVVQEENNTNESTLAVNADIVSVSVTGSENAYQFSVAIKSPDTGCERYADWWEIIRPDGSLLYRRILAHSHVSEQPFVRSGGPVTIASDEEVIVRAHMHPDGYGGSIFRGTVSGGFMSAELTADFAGELAEVPPFVEDCAG